MKTSIALFIMLLPVAAFAFEPAQRTITCQVTKTSTFTVGSMGAAQSYILTPVSQNEYKVQLVCAKEWVDSGDCFDGTKNADGTMSLPLTYHTFDAVHTGNNLILQYKYNYQLGVFHHPMQPYGIMRFTIDLQNGTGEFTHDYHENFSNIEAPIGSGVAEQSLVQCH